jgi:hypothetical protein
MHDWVLLERTRLNRSKSPFRTSKLPKLLDWRCLWSFERFIRHHSSPPPQDLSILWHVESFLGNGSVNTFPRQLMRMQQSKCCWKRRVSVWSVLICYTQGKKSVDSERQLSCETVARPESRELKNLHCCKPLSGNVWWRHCRLEKS